MAHNLYQDGARFISRNPAWHDLGKITGDFINRGQVIDTIVYPVTKEQAYDAYGNVLPVWYTVAHIDGKKNFLGAVGEGYTILPADSCLEGIDALMSIAPELKFETAGVLGQGERFWALVNLSASYNAAGYEHKTYLLMQGGHDGNHAVHYGLVDTTVVCNNTLDMANSEELSRLLRISHTRNGERKLEQAKRALQSMTRTIGDMKDTLEHLASKKVEQEHYQRLVDKLFPPKADAKVTTRRDNILTTILESYQEANEVTFPQTAGTAHNLLQAITGYVDHARGQDDTRAEVSMFGTGATMKEQALEIIMQESRSMSPATSRAWSHREQSSLLDSIIGNSIHFS